VIHSKSTEFSRVNGHFEGLGGLPPGIPTAAPGGTSILPRSSSSGYVWSEQKALDRDAHHVRSQESKYTVILFGDCSIREYLKTVCLHVLFVAISEFSGPSSELPYRSYDGQNKPPHGKH